MTTFDGWCARDDTRMGNHSMTYLEPAPGRLPDGVASVAAILPSHYASPDRVAAILGRLGKPEAAEYVRSKMPKGARSRSGDAGEILASRFVEETTGYTVGVLKLRWKDHREMAMRGDDILAIRADPVLAVRFLKGEVKSRAALAAKSVADARDALSSNHGRPTPHALAFLSDRLSETGHKALSDLIDDQLRQRIRKAQISHLLFVFTGTDPRRALEADLAAYTDTIPQHAVGLRVLAHQDFVKQIFDWADRDALDP